MSLVLYEYGPTRALRVSWTLQELGANYDSRAGRELIGSPELGEVHPMSKLPAIKDDGRPLFESAAICTWLADKHADKELGFACGSWERALHDQWTAFILTEVEAHLWTATLNGHLLPEDRRVKAIIPQCRDALKRSLPVLNEHLSTRDWLVANRFSVTDIIVGYATHWAKAQRATDGLPHLEAYNQRLLDRPLCPYAKLAGDD